MKTGLLVSGRHSLPRPWASRSRLLLRSHSLQRISRGASLLVPILCRELLLIAEKPLSVCACKQLQLDALGDHLRCSVLVLPTRVPRRTTIGRLTKSLFLFRPSRFALCVVQYKCRGGHQEHLVGTFFNHTPRTASQ